MTCPNCEAIIRASERRYETNAPGEPSFLEHGCSKCLTGRHVHRYAEHEDRLRNEHDERQISEARES